MALDFDYKDEEHISSEDFLHDAKEAKKRAKEEKKRRKKTKFSDKSHSVPGIVSSCLALAALGFIIAAIVVSTKARGEGGLSVGVLGGLSFAASLIGAICGLAAFHRTDVILRFAWIGVAANGIIWLAVTIMIAFGM